MEQIRTRRREGSGSEEPVFATGRNWDQVLRLTDCVTSRKFLPLNLQVFLCKKILDDTAYPVDVRINCDAYEELGAVLTQYKLSIAGSK